ncbi:MAG: type II toxin-antitoxin system VapB family antitoxin [Ornithinimicrobium sp.]
MRYYLPAVLGTKDAETDRLARELSEATGETLTDAVQAAVRQRLERVRGSAGRGCLATELNAIALRCAALPVLDPREPDEILGYDERGLST